MIQRLWREQDLEVIQIPNLGIRMINVQMDQLYNGLLPPDQQSHLTKEQLEVIVEAIVICWAIYNHQTRFYSNKEIQVKKFSGLTK